MTTTALTAALEAQAPELSATFAKMIRARYDRCVDRFGPALRGIHNSAEYGFAKNTLGLVTKRQGDRMGDPVLLVEEKLVAFCDRLADETVKAWLGKIEAKMGDLDAAEVHRVNATSFIITGTRAGRAVRIEQQMIVNVSSKGTLFNQFPARIRVDGKALSEAKYRALFA